MSLTRPTLVAGYLNTVRRLNKTFTVHPNTTLNQKLNIQPNAPIGEKECPIGSRYIVIGNGGRKFATGKNGLIIREYAPHSARDNSLYNMIPFVVRPMNDDLDTVTRGNYRLRRIESINGVNYVVYYAKLLPTAGSIDLEYRTIKEDGTISSEPFSFMPNDINPTPKYLTTDELNIIKSTYGVISLKTRFELTANDISELINACTITQGNSGYAYITEAAICSGLDRQVTTTLGNTNITYTEAVCCQTEAFIEDIYQEYQSSSTLGGFDIDLGYSAPLYGLST